MMMPPTKSLVVLVLYKKCAKNLFFVFYWCRRKYAFVCFAPNFRKEMKTSSVVKPNLLVSKSNLSDYASQGERRQSIYTGLNKRKLIHWLRLILRNQTILETYYSPWSYVGKTGFDDGFKTLERLNTFVFDLPVDVAIKQFQNMNEAF